MPNSLRPHGLQHASLSHTISWSLPSSCSLHRWCHPAISSSDALFSFCPQSFPASGTFSVNQLFASDDQNTVASASASVLPISIQVWFHLGMTGLISLLSKGLSGVFSSTTDRRHPFFGAPSFLPSSFHNCRVTGKTIALTIRTFVSRVMLTISNNAAVQTFICIYICMQCVREYPWNTASRIFAHCNHVTWYIWLNCPPQCLNQFLFSPLECKFPLIYVCAKIWYS